MEAGLLPQPEEIETIDNHAEVISLDAYRQSDDIPIPLPEFDWKPHLDRQDRLLETDRSRYTALDSLIKILPRRHPERLYPAFEEMISHPSPLIREMAAEHIPVLWTAHRFCALDMLRKLLEDPSSEVVSNAQATADIMMSQLREPLDDYLRRKLEISNEGS